MNNVSIAIRERVIICYTLHYLRIGWVGQCWEEKNIKLRFFFVRYRETDNSENNVIYLKISDM